MKGLGFTFIVVLFVALVSVLASSAETLQKNASAETRAESALAELGRHLPF